MKEIIEKLLEEVDPDIKEIMLRTVTYHNVGETYVYWELLQNVALTIIEWQRMRDYGNPKTEKTSKSNSRKSPREGT